MKLTVYNAQTGQITRCCEAPEELAAAQCSDGELWLAGAYEDDTFYIVDGTPVRFPEQPSPRHAFNWVSKRWELVDDVGAQWGVVRAERNQRLQATDWTHLSDIPQEVRDTWKPYRQALRDVTDQLDPYNIVWPTPPTA